MKTPRLALLALLFAFAPAANAAYPTWTVVDEGYRDWPTIRFQVGKDFRSLRCRFAECDPSKNKGRSNLYLMTQVGAPAPIKATIYKMVPRSKLNPAYYYDGPYDKVPEVIDSILTTFATELSYYQLDNSGKGLAVVQGTNRYPASTDIDQAQLSASGSKIRVVPPAKMADDQIKPKPAVPPGGRARGPLAWWCDPLTGAVRRAINGLMGWIPLESRSSVCRKPEASGPPAAVAASVLAVTPKETKWLTKGQAKDLENEMKSLPADGATREAALKATADKFRAVIIENLKPNAAAGAAYAAAIVAPKSSADVDGALPANVWGGAVTSIVTSSGTNLEIQLSPAEYAVLSSSNNAAALRTYETARGGADGNNGTNDAPSFSESSYDPIQLHLAAEAARKVVGTAATAPEQTPKTEPAPNLTPAELALLTPDELTKYIGMLNAAKGPPVNQSALEALSKMSGDLRAAIKADGRAPYAAPKTAAEFEGLKPWQKAQYCKPSAGAAAETTNPAQTDDAHGKIALPDLIALAGKISAQGGLSASSPAWAADACNKFKGQLALTPNPNAGGTGGRGAVAAIVPGVDKENDAKKKSEWLNSDLLTSAAKGAMVGLLVGSLFGPVGLIAGPILGAALFYGLTKITG